MKRERSDRLAMSVIKGLLRDGPYAWPGGYPMYFVTADGEALSFEAVRKCWREVCRSHVTSFRDPCWSLVAFDVNWEDAELYCAHTHARIPSAYAEDTEA